jgi:hypothetical protein
MTSQTRIVLLHILMAEGKNREDIDQEVGLFDVPQIE